MTEGIRKSGNDRGRDLTNVIFTDKTERTIPQSAFGSQLTLHKGAMKGDTTVAAVFCTRGAMWWRGCHEAQSIPPLMVRGGVERSETEGIRKWGNNRGRDLTTTYLNKIGNRTDNHLPLPSPCTRGAMKGVCDNI